METLPNSDPQTDWRNYVEMSPLYVPIAFAFTTHFYSVFYSSLKQIKAYCPKCKKIQLYNRINEDYSLATNNVIINNRIYSFEFICVEHNCGCLKSFFINVERTKDQLIFTKCGEYPSLKPRVEDTILDAFPEEAELLKKALCCLKDGFGVGAFAYLRQALEDRIDVFIAEIRKNATEQGDTKVLQKLNKLHANSPASDKIKIAKNALPASLQVNGHNPLGLLYGNLSEGIHGLSDSECLGKANAIYSALTFILKTLAENSASRKQFISDLNSLSK